MEKTFYIFRHGQSSYNLAGRTQGRTNDSVLTDLGKEQAAEIGNKLKDKNINIIICSPLIRACQTAEIANKKLNVPIVYDERFIEVDVGEIEGMHYTDVISQFGEKYQKWRSCDQQYENLRFTGGESKKEVRERVFAGLNEYATTSSHSNIAISSHGIMLAQLLISFGKNNTDIPNGSILCVKFKNGTWDICGFI